MNSILLDDIKRKEQQILECISEKEKFFYAYLNKKPISTKNFDDLGEIDKICLAAFTKIRTEELDVIVERNKKAKAVAGFHFSKNLITLCSFATYDRSIIENDVRSYFAVHGLKEKFIINQIFGNGFELRSDNISLPIEMLIDRVFVRNQFDDVIALIIQALETCTDPIELYIIKQAYIKAAALHPNFKIENNNILLKEKLLLFTNTVTFKFDRLVDIVVGIIVIALIPSCLLIIDLWDKKGLEAKFVAIEFAVTFISIALYRIFRKKVSIWALVESLKLKLVKWWFRIHNLDYIKVQELIKDENSI